MSDEAPPTWDADDQARYDRAVAGTRKTIIYAAYLRDSGDYDRGYATLDDAIAEMRRDHANGPASIRPWWISDGTQHWLIETDGSLIPMTPA